VFCGLGGARLQPTILAGIIQRATARSRIQKHITAHTLRHTAATWLCQATGDTRLVAEYLGDSDLSTVSRYAHVAEEELHAAAQVLANGAAHHPAAPRRRMRSRPPPPTASTLSSCPSGD
jgi:site-specific recombinase XerD